MRSDCAALVEDVFAHYAGIEDRVGNFNETRSIRPLVVVNATSVIGLIVAEGSIPERQCRNRTRARFKRGCVNRTAQSMSFQVVSERAVAAERTIHNRQCTD